MAQLLEPALLLNDAHGVYIPQLWAQAYGEESILSAEVRAEDVATVLEGPDHEWYWEAWNDILNNYKHVVKGTAYLLHQDGDLWEYPEGFQFEEMY